MPSESELAKQAAALGIEWPLSTPLPPAPTAHKPARVYGPIDIHITLDTEVGDPELDPETGQCIGPGATIAQLIVEQAVTRILPKLHEDVSKAVIATAQEEITAQVSAIVAATLAEPFQITDQWGHRQGSPVTIRERIADEIKAQLQPAKQNYQGHNTTSTTLSDVIKSEVDTALRTELNEAVREARTVVVGAVRSKAADIIGEVVISALKR